MIHHQFKSIHYTDLCKFRESLFCSNECKVINLKIRLIGYSLFSLKTYSSGLHKGNILQCFKMLLEKTPCDRLLQSRSQFHEKESTVYARAHSNSHDHMRSLKSYKLSANSRTQIQTSSHNKLGGYLIPKTYFASGLT